ncbi:YeeE/YedE family protein [Catenovulum sp. SM1970]|uniref:YeeE/YedE family protein n=1 Tax=Marinifaba aquimaris TaxID=2741323 RepID=UPI001572A174|nr:YeeE/YedE family protein [Marinifaba aquimaris]NTS76491.1 YeeE/YedE family protein [Marinifaba aquimaris]
MQTYYPALFGGILIGLSALLLMFSIGRIAGISGISFTAIQSLTRRPKTSHWRWYFLAGLILATLITQFVFELPIPTIDRTSPVIIVAGLLVGFGTHLGSGCTSGHGICGISRLSIRSITATGIFMLVAMITVYITQYIV